MTGEGWGRVGVGVERGGVGWRGVWEESHEWRNGKEKKVFLGGSIFQNHVICKDDVL